ncbi:MAG: M14 family metallopeptidase [Chitinophagaceae bacterium]
MKKLFFFLLLPCLTYGQSLKTRFEKTSGQETATYTETIAFFKQVDQKSDLVQMKEYGNTDAGYPLHLVLVSADKDFDIASLKRKNRRLIFINNGIHPGEPDGIDASMQLVRDIAEKRKTLPQNVVLAIIPVYNVGGMLNRSANYRVDQDGPAEFGFRGNAQNYDLNRDFIKVDTRNAKTFTQIFHLLDPDVFVDNHVSNGADYQHVMTLIASQHNRLGGEMGKFMNQTFEPALYSLMKQKGFDLVPYVNHFGETPEKGWSEFWDSPRYSSGYASLFNTFAFVPETHMLKPYPQRVQATYALMESFIDFTSKNSTQIGTLREQHKAAQMAQKDFPIAWKLDRSQSKQISYKGYASGRKQSEVSGLPRLYYDRAKPFEVQVPFYNFYRDTLSVQKPVAYIIPQGWWKVIERLNWNGVRLRQLPNDTTIEVESYRIEKYNSSPRPFEGHHVNSGVLVSVSNKKVSFRAGDYYIPMDQPAARFITEVLEPQAEDSYFAWNFFDPILGQKEGFSDYVFEETAAQFLKEAPEVKRKLEERRAADPEFAKSARAQLNFVFQNSPYYEPAHMQYPVYRLMK